MITYTFNYGPRVDIINEKYDVFLVKFYSNENGTKKFTEKALVQNNTYYSLLREWYTNWYIEVYYFDTNTEQLKLYDTHQFDLANKSVAIVLFPNTEEDEIIWMKECEKFKALHRCDLTIINIKKTPGTRPTNFHYATYDIGRFNIKENSTDKYGDFEHYNGKINDVYLTYDSFKNPTDWKNLNSFQIIDDILGMQYIESNEITFSERLSSFYSNLSDKTQKNILDPTDIFNVNFIDGPFLEILGVSNNIYTVKFINADTNEVIYSTDLTPNHWAKANIKYYINWKIEVLLNDKIIFEHKFNCTDKRVYIALDSKSLGDTIAWFSYVEEFRKKYNCTVICSTFWNNLFQDKYPEIEFVNPGDTVSYIYAMFTIGIFGDGYSNTTQNKRDTRNQPLQSVATDILGLEFKEIKPHLTPAVKLLGVNKYICIAEHGSAQAKYWNNPGGWQAVVDYLVSIGYEVRVISKEPTTLKNVIDSTGNAPIEKRISELKGADAFIGISSGLSWLAWAVGIPVIMISGHTNGWYEFQCNRISPPADTCHGCWHNYDFDKGNWNWCPIYEYTSKQFECTKQITPNVVIDEINKVLSGNESEVKNKEITPKKLKFSEFYIANIQYPVDLIIEGREEERSMFDEIFNRKVYSFKPYCSIEPGDIVFDVGGNIGMFSRYASVEGASKIYAFEPEQKNAELFLKNKPDNCTFFNIGISSEVGKKELNIDGTIGGHSIMETNTFGTKTGNKQFVMFDTLNNIIAKENISTIDFLKIDVEGAEFEVMKGLTNINLAKIRKCVVEYHHNVFNYDDTKKTQFIKRFILNDFTFHEEIINKHFQILYFWR